MSTYRNIHGRAIRSVSTDPTAEVTEGEIWYNTTSDTFKSVVTSEAWASGAPLITGVYGSMQFGLQTAGVAASGSASPGPTTATQEYNGSGWSSGGNVGSQRYRGGAGGTLTAGVIFGGESPGGDSTATEEYDGSSWTNGGAMTKARRTTGIGIQTAASAVGGYDNSNKLATVEDYNGSSWTSGTNLPLSGTIDSGSGLTSSARVAGGIYGPGSTHPPSSPQTFNNNIGWDGTSWSDDTAIPVNRYNNSGFGTSSDDYYTAGGRNPSPATLNTTVYWDGSAWSSAPNLATARYNGQGINGTPSAFFFAGGNPGEYTNTEEFNKSANVITAGAWGTGGAMNTGRSLMGSFGTRTAAVAVAGLKNPYATYSNDTEKYDGTSWTNSGNYPQTVYSVGATGTSTAGLAFGGQLPGSPESNTTCEFDGSTWTAVPGNVPVSGGFSNGFGTQTAAIANLPGASTTIAYDGSSWTAFGSPGNMNTARLDGYGQNGTSTAGLVVAGRTGSGPVNTTNTEEWNGSTWSASGAYPVAMVFVQSNGTQTAAAGAGGDKMPGEAAQTTTCTYDGSTWATAPNLGTAVTRQGSASGAPSTQGTIYSGNIPAITTTQEFTGETTALNVKTLTQS